MSRKNGILKSNVSMGEAFAFHGKVNEDTLNEAAKIFGFSDKLERCYTSSDKFNDKLSGKMVNFLKGDPFI